MTNNNKKNSQQLLDAVRKGNSLLVKELIENQGISASIENFEEYSYHGLERKSAIHCAIQYGNIELMKYLLEKGASLLALNETYYNQTAIINSETAFKMGLEYSLDHKNLQMLKVLIQYGDANMFFCQKRDDNKTVMTCPLIISIQNKQSDFVKYLLQAGANPNCYLKEPDQDEKYLGVSALHFAAYETNHKTINMLIKYGANVNCFRKGRPQFNYKYISINNFDYYEATPLNIAIKFNRIENACLLILNFANINIKGILHTRNKETIELINSDQCKSEEMKQLIEYNFSKSQLRFLPQIVKTMLIVIMCSLKRKNIRLRFELLFGKCLKKFYSFQ